MSKVIEYAIRSHLHLAIFSFVYVSALYKENAYSTHYALMFAFGILSIYNFHRLWKLRRGDLPYGILVWLKSNKLSIAMLSFSSVISTMYIYLSYFSEQYLIHLLCAICVSICILYVCRIRRYSLREIPYLKIFLVFGIWSFLLHIMPYMLFGNLVFPLGGLLLLFAILIPSDMKDIDFDPEEMKTIPQLLGTNNSLNLIRMLSILGISYSVIVYDESMWAWVMSFSYMLVLTFFYSRINKDYFFVWIDACFLIVGVVLFCY